jgi:hypothetical protein
MKAILIGLALFVGLVVSSLVITEIFDVSSVVPKSEVLEEENNDQGEVEDDVDYVSQLGSAAVKRCYKLAYVYAGEEQWSKFEELKSGKHFSKTLLVIKDNVEKCKGRADKNPVQRIGRIKKLLFALESEQGKSGFAQLKVRLEKEFTEIDEELDLVFARTLLQTAVDWPRISKTVQEGHKISEADAMKRLLVLHDRAFPGSLRKMFDKRVDISLQRVP